MRVQIKKAIAKLLGRTHQCEKCGSWNTKHSPRWVRGWNHWCNQAYSDWGAYCNKCRHITFDKPLDEHLKTLPDWCSPYNRNTAAAKAAKE